MAKYPTKTKTYHSPTKTYSAKAGAAGKDLGKPGKGFAAISRKAAHEYGSKGAGMRVAGAVLNKLRGPGR